MSGFSCSPQQGGRDVIVHSSPCEEETNWTENFPGPWSTHYMGASMGIWLDASRCLQWGMGVGPHSQRGSSGDWGEHLGLGAAAAKHVLGAVHSSACQPVATRGACVLAEFPSPCLYLKWIF